LGRWRAWWWGTNHAYTLFACNFHVFGKLVGSWGVRRVGAQLNAWAKNKKQWGLSRAGGSSVFDLWHGYGN
jgi:hypothetical protein